MNTAGSGAEHQYEGVFRALPGGLDGLVRRLAAGMPPLLEAGRQDVELHFRRVLHEQLARLDLCSRSDFEAQERVLGRLQQRLVDCEARIVALEQQADLAASGSLGTGAPPPTS
jgi:hypothetical protein